MTEIAAWPLASEPQRRAIVAMAAARLAAKVESFDEAEPRT
jgi:predicted Fe-S protein YdhL (DUF1289 family)